jgi:phosphatidylglycerophosphatase A
MSAWATRFATFFGAGYFPIASGTFASAVALPFGWLLVHAGWKWLLLAAFIATVIGIWACGVHAKKVRIHDPSECVIDEVAGQWLALLPAALAFREDWRPFVMAFFLFRLFDVLKPWPLSAAERLPGGWGIMADDVLAGLIAAACLFGMLYIRLI